MFLDLRVSSLRNCYGLPRDTRTCSRPALVGAVYPNRPGDWGQLPLPIFSFLRSHGAVRVWDWGAHAPRPPQVRTQDGFVRRRNGFAVANVLVVASRDDEVLSINHGEHEEHGGSDRMNRM